MLTYVFWHQRAGSVAREEYQAKLVAFHQILQERQPQGFVGSLVLEMASLPWMTEESEVYEDWYFVENSAALDPLDQAAVSGICREPHQQIARLAGQGTGGLYRLKSASLDLTRLVELRHATWFSKPSGMSYDKLYSLLEHREEAPQDILWQRQMTMGPALEFCIHSSQPGRLAAEIARTQVQIRPLFVPAR